MRSSASQGFTITEKSHGRNVDFIKFKGMIGQVDKGVQNGDRLARYGHFAK